MKSKAKIFIICIILIILLLQMFSSYATNKSQKFFTVDKTEISLNDIIELNINLDEISYQKFSVKIESSYAMDNVQTEEQGITINNENNQTSIDIDKDTLKDVTTIKLDYRIQETLNVGDEIKLIATVTNLENDEEKQSIEAQVKVVENESNKDNSSDNNKPNKTNTDNAEQDAKEQSVDMKGNTGSNGFSNNSQNNNLKTGSSSMYSGSGNTKTVTYNGSSNNYLKKLKVSGYTFTSDFSKENTNYFLTVENDVESVNIITKTEDSDAKITIYGNDNLKEGLNKVLIYVTAENGSVRIYRIYVTKDVE